MLLLAYRETYSKKNWRFNGKLRSISQNAKDFFQTEWCRELKESLNI